MKNFEAYRVALEAVRLTRPHLETILRRDPDLGRQLRRCLPSVPSHVAEGSHSTGGNQRERYANAMSSARESIACLETAACLGYLDEAQLTQALDKLDHVVAILFKLRRR